MNSNNHRDDFSSVRRKIEQEKKGALEFFEQGDFADNLAAKLEQKGPTRGGFFTRLQPGLSIAAGLCFLVGAVAVYRHSVRPSPYSRYVEIFSSVRGEPMERDSDRAERSEVSKADFEQQPTDPYLEQWALILSRLEQGRGFPGGMPQKIYRILQSAAGERIGDQLRLRLGSSIGRLKEQEIHALRRTHDYSGFFSRILKALEEV